MPENHISENVLFRRFYEAAETQHSWYLDRAQWKLVTFDSLKRRAKYSGLNESQEKWQDVKLYIKAASQEILLPFQGVFHATPVMSISPKYHHRRRRYALRWNRNKLPVSFSWSPVLTDHLESSSTTKAAIACDS